MKTTQTIKAALNKYLNVWDSIVLALSPILSTGAVGGISVGRFTVGIPVMVPFPGSSRGVVNNMPDHEEDVEAIFGRVAVLFRSLISEM